MKKKYVLSSLHNSTTMTNASLLPLQVCVACHDEEQMQVLRDPSRKATQLRHTCTFLSILAVLLPIATAPCAHIHPMAWLAPTRNDWGLRSIMHSNSGGLRFVSCYYEFRKDNFAFTCKLQKYFVDFFYINIDINIFNIFCYSYVSWLYSPYS